MIKGKCICTPIMQKSMQLDDVVGHLIKNITDRWLLDIRETNPAILDMFHDSDQSPQRHMLPWSGEFAGKYLTNAAQIYSITRDPRLFSYLTSFVDELISYQKPNGYLGPWPQEYQLTGRAPVMGYCFDPDFKPHDSQTWDAWAHYHIMYGLMRWYELTEDQKVMTALRKIADLFCEKFFGENGYRLWNNGDQDMNLAPIHSFVLLYQLTGEEKYLQFAHEVEKDFEKPPAGDYIRCALAGQEFYQMPKPRWESLHSVQGIAELYLATGDEKYKQAFENIWWSILKTDVHNTGGFSSREQAVGDPYHNWQIETCCVIAYMATTVDMLRLTGDSVVADAMEWATYNSSLGSFSPSGRWSTYNTPMEGYKRANYHDIGFQCRPGSPDLNCCSVNAPRAFGMITDWAYMTEDTGALCVNYYGQGKTILYPDSNNTVTIKQQTDYPYNDHVRLTVSGWQDTERVLKLRIPYWSSNPTIMLNDLALSAPQAGSYYTIERIWHDGDVIDLDLGFCLRFWAGEKDYEGKSAIFYVPLLLCFDPYYDFHVDFEHLPRLDAQTMQVSRVENASYGGKLFTCTTAEGDTITLCDLYTAGISGNPYTTWFATDHVEKQPFSHDNIQRTMF